MGHTKTNWERRALKAEADLREVTALLAQKSPALTLFPYLMNLWEARIRVAKSTVWDRASCRFDEQAAFDALNAKAAEVLE